MPRHQDQGVCYYRKMPETRKKCLKSGLKMLEIKAHVYSDQRENASNQSKCVHRPQRRCLKSRQMCTKIRASVPENPVLKFKASIPITWISMPEIQTNVPQHHDQHACYYRQMPEAKIMCLESGSRYRNNGQCA